jgi:hypothetical protein
LKLKDPNSTNKLVNVIDENIKSILSFKIDAYNDKVDLNRIQSDTEFIASMIMRQSPN